MKLGEVMKTFKISPESLPNVMSTVIEDAHKKTIRACQNTVNIQAALTHKNAVQNVKNDFTLRNEFTVRNITYTQCPKSVTKYEDIQSQAGARDRIDYMARQEKGGEHKSKKAGAPLAIPTTLARGGSNQNQIKPKYRLNKMKTVNYNGGRSYASRQSHFVAMAYIASTHKLLLNFSKGIYEVTNFKSLDGTVSFKLNEIRNKKYDSTTTKPNPWLEPASQKPAADCQEIFNQQMSLV